MQRSSCQVRAYSIRHDYEVEGFLEAYRQLLQRAIDEIWKNIVWKERYVKTKRRLIPLIPKENGFKRNLRGFLLENWSHAKHYVDSAVKQAYSILKSWRRNYLKGNRSRTKPIVRKKFVRIKETLYSCRDSKIRISIKPHEKYLEFDISRAWFLSRAKGDMGELILNEKFLTITFTFRQKAEEIQGKIAWDCNKRSLDGFNPILGWVRIDLTEPLHIHRVYELKRRRLQSLSSKKSSLKKVLTKYSSRERNRVRDFLHKLTTGLAKRFEGYLHGFEDLKKDRMFNRSKKHNREVAKSDWKMIQRFMAYKSTVIPLNPHNSTRRCSRCGMVNTSKGASYECRRCGLKMDRHLNASINLYLQMEGLSPRQRLFKELVKAWSGFDLTGEEANENPNELGRDSRLMRPKGYICLSKTM